MCGMSGCAGSLGYKEEQVARDLLFMNTLRGEDSTGVATLEKGKNQTIKIAKVVGPPWFLTDTKKFDKVMKGSLALVMQHNRKATVGAKTEMNAHPFEYGDIVGMHNGTITDWYLRDLPKYEDFETDSKVLINSIDKIGIEKTIAAIPDNENMVAYAIVWYDAKDHSINFARNSKRELFYCLSDNRHDLFWSSEIEMLASAVNRREVVRTDKSKIYSVMPGKHYKFKIPKSGDPFLETVTRDLKHKAVVYGGGSSDNRPFPRSFNQKETPAEKVVRETFGTTGKVTDSTTESRLVKNALNLMPHDAVARQLKSGKDKFALFYKDDTVRVYFDSNSKSYHRYWWNTTETKFFHSELRIKPQEVISMKDNDIAELINGGRVRIGRPFGASPLTDPKDEPKYDPEKERVVHTGQRVLVTRTKEPTKDPWNLYRWNPSGAAWMKHVSNYPPNLLPDTMIDITSDHTFKWHGKGDKRRVHYKIDKNRPELTRPAFNEITEQGCANCSRTPTWTEGRKGGVKIHFLGNDHDFLCEFCAQDKTLLAGLKRLVEQDMAKGKTVETFN